MPDSEVTKMSLSTKVAMYDNSEKTWRLQDDPKPEDANETCTSDSFSQALGLKVLELHTQTFISLLAETYSYISSIKTFVCVYGLVVGQYL